MIVPPQPNLGQRSPHWQKFRDDFVRGKACAGCGRTDQLQAHHVRPFHLFPELELDPDNVIPLCEGIRNCHYVLGHAYCWRGFNPGVRIDTVQFRERVAHSLDLAGGVPDPIMPMIDEQEQT